MEEEEDMSRMFDSSHGRGGNDNGIDKSLELRIYYRAPLTFRRKDHEGVRGTTCFTSR